MDSRFENAQRLPAEIYYAEELARLREKDLGPRPPGWQLSPKGVEAFVLGDEELGATPKFVAPAEIVTRVVIALATQRGAIETMQQLLYTWNSAILKHKGPCLKALIPGPIYRAMQNGILVRYEETARSSPALQDALLSIMSERSINIRALSGDDSVLYAQEGFNLVATSNTSDEGVNAMSAALKRRMNFETIVPIKRVEDEIAVVVRESRKLLLASGVDVKPDEDIVRCLVTIFHELRNGQTLDGRSTDRLAAAVLSTAEAVSVAHAMGVYAYYYRDGVISPEDFNNFLVGAAIKDDLSDLKRMDHYFETEVARREEDIWKTVLQDWRTRF